MEILLSVYPNMRTISHLIPKSSYLGVCALCMFKIQTGENWTQEQLILFLWDICQPKKGISVTIHHPNFIFFVSTSVTFNENESYFLISRLQGENLITKDKNLFSCFIDPFLIDHLKVSDPISIPLIDHINPPKVSDLVFVPFFKLKSFLSLLFIIKRLTKYIQGRKLQFHDLYMSKNPNRLLKMRPQSLILPYKLS